MIRLGPKITQASQSCLRVVELPHAIGKPSSTQESVGAKQLSRIGHHQFSIEEMPWRWRNRVWLEPRPRRHMVSVNSCARQGEPSGNRPGNSVPATAGVGEKAQGTSVVSRSDPYLVVYEFGRHGLARGRVSGWARCDQRAEREQPTETHSKKCLSHAHRTSANASRATANVSAMSCSLCAADMNPASNADGARYTPRLSMPWKKRLNIALSAAMAWA